MDVGQIVEHHGFLFEGESWAEQVAKTIYFSAITLLSVGYGDITPIGWSRMVAILEALVGYLLPAVITVQYLRLFPSAIERFFHFIKPTDKKNK
jgi:potassium channel LctB